MVYSKGKLKKGTSSAKTCINHLLLRHEETQTVYACVKYNKIVFSLPD